MKKLLASLGVAMLLLTACGREAEIDGSDLTTAESSAPTASADATATSAPGATAKASAAPGGAAATGAPASAAATSAPGTSSGGTPAEGKANTPADGTYVYTYTGESSDPFNPAGPPRKFNGELTRESTHSGNVYTEEITNSEEAGRRTVRTRWSSTKVEMLSLRTQSPVGDFACEFDPPIVIAKFPLKAEVYPTQQLKGEGNLCTGSIDITYVRKTTVADATKKSWPVWEVKVRTQGESGQLKLTQNETRYVSPELGFEVKTVANVEGQYGAQRFKSNSTSTLKSHP